ncbi:oxysterol-binding protein [Niveomyces insectorum RCEF 264]|uniref:Oxysterol-binding protein n=1 Tax=Niveomyces insectorum RCEF 264 TaxID=1081102 RepID=A0A168A5G5_9HYPO|nr:oxysterol-binding protein [Niveomyces insectorum RCEF 264]
MDSKSLSARCRELLQFLASTKGDLANVTGPPSMLAPLSVVEVGRCWAQRPAVFAAPALEPDASRRCLLVLRMVLIALRTQMYVGGAPGTSIKKPLNAFLGELFLAEWTDERPHGAGDGSGSSNSRSSDGSGSGSDSAGSSCTSLHTNHNRHASNLSRTTTAASSSPSLSSTSSSTLSSSSSSTSCTCGSDRITTRLVAEQVSHHPPITAMHIADEAHGVRADGYARVEMTFAGAVQVRQVGHAVVRVDAYDETYLIPLPDIRVRGFLSGRLYPEITDTYHVVGSNGYAAEIAFSGQGFAWGGKRNAFKAKVYDRAPEGSGNTTTNSNSNRTVLYTVEGVWSEGWTTRDARTGAVLERYEVDAPANAPAPIVLPDVDEQDPWESRRAWHDVIDGITRGDLGQTVAEKTKIEQAQRRMRAQEAAAGTDWSPLLFRSSSSNSIDSHPDSKAALETFRQLAAGTGWQLHDDRTKGVWRVDEAKLKTLQRPFRGKLTPLG